MTEWPRLGLADTSLFIAQEKDRPIRARPPDELCVSVITFGELRAGVLAAKDSATRARRLETCIRAQFLEPIPVDEDVAEAWAALRVALRDRGEKMPLNDSWIAATAMSRGIPVVAQDSDYDNVPGLLVIRV